MKRLHWVYLENNKCLVAKPPETSRAFELVKTCHFIYILQLAGNTTRMNFFSLMVNILLRRQLLQSHFDSKLGMTKERGFNMEKYIAKASQ